MDPADSNDPPDASALSRGGDAPPMRSGSGSVAAAPVAGIFVARKAQSGQVGPKARFSGRYALRGGCLTFVGGGAVYLPVLAPQTPVRIFTDRVEIGGRSHPFARETTIVGGALDASAAATLNERPPAACAWPLLMSGAG